jgi:hypothetical protein
MKRGVTSLRVTALAKGKNRNDVLVILRNEAICESNVKHL